MSLLYRRWIQALLAGLLLFIALTGALQLQTDTSPNNLLVSSHGSYQRYQEFISEFPLEQQQVQLIVRGPVLSKGSINTLLAWERELVALGAVTEVYSFLSDARARRMADAPEDLKTYLLAHPSIKEAFLSENFETTLVAVALREEIQANPELLSGALKDMRAIVQRSDNALDVAFTGLPVLSETLASSLVLDVWSYIVLGALAAIVMAYLFIRNLAVVLVSLAAPLLGTLLVYGAMGWSGLELTLVTQLIGVLVFVVAYTDSLFLCRHFLVSREKAKEPTDLINSTYREVGPACVATSATTALGFGSLMLSSAYPIRELGMLGIFAVVLTLIVVMVFLPLTLTVLNSMNPPVDSLTRFTRHVSVGGEAGAHDSIRLWLFASLLVCLLLGATGLRSNYTVGENLPLESEYRQSMLLADEELGGLIPVQVRVRWRDPAQLTPGRRMTTTLFRLKKSLKDATGSEWHSVANVLRTIPGVRVRDKLAVIPENVVDRFLNFETGTVLLSTRLEYNETDSLGNYLDQLAITLPALEQQNPELRLDVVGTIPLAVGAGKRILPDLLRCLAVAFFAIFITLALFFRSMYTSIVLLLPSVGAVAAVALLLVILGEPIRYVTMMVFSLCLGLVIDHSIHIGFRADRLQRLGESQGRSVSVALKEVGSTALVAQCVLLAGFATLIISHTPTISDVGLLSVAALIVGLVLNLFFLPVLLRLKPLAP